MTDRNERRPGSADKTVRDIRRATRRRFSAEEKIRIVLEGLHPREQTSMERCFDSYFGGRFCISEFATLNEATDVI